MGTLFLVSGKEYSTDYGILFFMQIPWNTFLDSANTRNDFSIYCFLSRSLPI